MMSAGTSDKQRVLKRQRNVRLAQLDRAFGYGPKGRGFESSCPRLILLESVNIALSPNGKALDSDSSISGVRIPQAQLVPRKCLRGLFFSV